MSADDTEYARQLRGGMAELEAIRVARKASNQILVERLAVERGVPAEALDFRLTDVNRRVDAEIGWVRDESDGSTRSSRSTNQRRIKGGVVSDDLSPEDRKFAAELAAQIREGVTEVLAELAEYRGLSREGIEAQVAAAGLGNAAGDQVLAEFDERMDRETVDALRVFLHRLDQTFAQIVEDKP